MSKVQLGIVLGVGLLSAANLPLIAHAQPEPQAWHAYGQGDTTRALSRHGRQMPGSRRVAWGAGPRLPGDAAPPDRGAVNPFEGARQSDAERPTAGPVADPNLLGANGAVFSMARSGNTLYIAGNFRSVGENSGGWVGLDGRTGEALRPYPKVAGYVNVMVPDGSGGWYIGGEFTGVGGVPRACLAQIRADGSLTDWNPRVTGSPGFITPPSVFTLVVSGARVFVGGDFREINGQPHIGFGCVDAHTGAVLDWNLDVDWYRDPAYPSGSVSTLAVHDSLVFVGGNFFTIGGQSRSYLAAVNAVTGAVSPWRADSYRMVYALLVRDDTLFVAGEFAGTGAIAGGTRNLIAAIDIHTAQLLPFDARPRWVDPVNPYAPYAQIASMALAGDTLYVAGNFIEIGGQPRASIAALNATTGDALAWTPPSVGPRYDLFPPPRCGSLVVAGGAVYVGGEFGTLDGQSHQSAAALSRESGELLEWNPKPDYTSGPLAAQDGKVYLGGPFSLVGEWRHRAGLAAIDLTTGALKPWNPNPNGTNCSAVVVNGGRVFVTGDFTVIGGNPTPRRYIAALDTLNGEVVDWDPGTNEVAEEMVLQDDNLFLGGWFTQVGGQPRNYLAAISASSGEVLPWDPNAGGTVLGMALSGNTLYVGGMFSTMGGLPRKCIAAVSAIDGSVMPWNPTMDNIVEALLVSGDRIYVGGGFEHVGGQPSRMIAALDLETGSALPWHPTVLAWDIYPRVWALAMSRGQLYVGGTFGLMGGQPRVCLAVVDTATGLATEWDPGADGYVWSLASYGDDVYVGGGFARVGGLPAIGLAAFHPPARPLPLPTSFAMAQCVPNPVRSRAEFQFALPKASAVTLAVYDIQGRRTVTLLSGATLEPGTHSVPLQVEGWKPGIYFYRIEAGGRTAVRKMLVVP